LLGQADGSTLLDSGVLSSHFCHLSGLGSISKARPSVPFEQRRPANHPRLIACCYSIPDSPPAPSLTRPLARYFSASSPVSKTLLLRIDDDVICPRATRLPLPRNQLAHHPQVRSSPFTCRTVIHRLWTVGSRTTSSQVCIRPTQHRPRSSLNALPQTRPLLLSTLQARILAARISPPPPHPRPTTVSHPHLHVLGLFRNTFSVRSILRKGRVRRQEIWRKQQVRQYLYTMIKRSIPIPAPTSLTPTFL